MVIGILILSFVAGSLAAVGLLLAGYGVVAALIGYVVAGALAVTVLAVLQLVRGAGQRRVHPPSPSGEAAPQRQAAKLPGR